MTVYWLAPLRWEGDNAVIGQERIALAPDAARQSLQKLLQSVHPRFLLTFKASALLSEEDGACCTAENGLPFSFSAASPIVLASGAPQADEGRKSRWPMSHCALAYFEKLPSPRSELPAWLKEAERRLSAEREWPHRAKLAEWLRLMTSWQEQGCYLLLLREDG